MSMGKRGVGKWREAGRFCNLGSRLKKTKVRRDEREGGKESGSIMALKIGFHEIKSMSSICEFKTKISQR